LHTSSTSHLHKARAISYDDLEFCGEVRLPAVCTRSKEMSSDALSIDVVLWALASFLRPSVCAWKRLWSELSSSMCSRVVGRLGRTLEVKSCVPWPYDCCEFPLPRMRECMGPMLLAIRPMFTSSLAACQCDSMVIVGRGCSRHPRPSKRVVVCSIFVSLL
jgi:hypothetical protein